MIMHEDDDVDDADHDDLHLLEICFGPQPLLRDSESCYDTAAVLDRQGAAQTEREGPVEAQY